MAEYSATKSYQEKNNPHYFIFFPNSEKPIKAIINHFPPDTPANLDFNVIKVREMTATPRAPNGHTHVEPLPLFLVILTRNIKSQEIF
jgi:hypothetical protein